MDARAASQVSHQGELPVEPTEIEAKYRLEGPDGHARLRRRLVALGARAGDTTAEDNQLFDRPDRSLGAANRVLRLRVLNGGPAGRLTYKGPATRSGVLKQRTELEVAVDDSAVTRAILEALGYQPTVRYLKQRETWYLQGAEVALDTLVFGWYCEIEGPAEVIPGIAAALGLSAASAEPTGYPGLMARYEASQRP